MSSRNPSRSGVTSDSAKLYGNVETRRGGLGKSPSLTESVIARTCSDFLAADGWRMLITDPVSNRERGKGFAAQHPGSVVFAGLNQRGFGV